MKCTRNTVAIAAVLMMVSSVWAREEAAQPPELPYSIERHELKVNLDLDRNYITARDQITLKRKIKRPETLDLLLRKGLKVKGVWMGEERLDFRTIMSVDPFSFEALVDSEDVAYYGRAQVVNILLPKDIAKKKELFLGITYEGAIRDSVQSGDFSREYVTDQITGVIDYRGIYLGAEAIYYPALPGQIFTFSLDVTVPAGVKCVSEGKLEEAMAGNGQRTERWVCVHPMDAFHIVGGRYQVKSTMHNGVEISTYFFPEEADLSERYLEACKGYIDLYGELIGPYPFEKFAVVDNFFASGYGMPSFTLLGSQVLRLPWIISISLGHEICHNWWGNSVYVNYGLGNWCEGVTVYCADYLYKERKSLNDARQYRMNLLRDFTAYTNKGNDFPLREFRERHNPAQRAVGYGKSAMVFHMLRSYIGEDDFWRALRRFYRDNVWSHASWEDIRKAFEKESAIKLKWYFEQWVERSGAPLLKIETPQKDKAEGAWELSFILRQIQDGEPFVLEIPIVVRGISQEAHLRAGVNQKAQEVMLKTIFEPVSFSVDPDFNLFRRLSRDEVAPTLSEVFGARDLIIVLPGLAPPELQDAYRAIATQLVPQGGDHLRVLRDDEIGGEDLKSSALLYFGTPAENRAIPPGWINNDRWRVQNESYWLLGEEHTDPHAAFLAVERHPENSEMSMGFFCARTAVDVLAVGRKLRHYGKYSYLVFYAGKNVAKGNWEISESPLTYNFKGE